MISLLTMTGGRTDVEGHRAGCADIAKKVAKRQCEEPWTADFASKRDAFLEYNSDFIDEADGDESNGWVITWFPCCDLPDETDKPVDILDETIANLLAPVVEAPMTKTAAYGWVKRSREGLRDADAAIYTGTADQIREALMETIGAATMLLDALDNQGIKGL